MGDILIGTSSWSERTLVHESRWYPRRNMKAAERVAHYTERFPLVEIDATSRFPPTPELARQWVERTPPGFTMDIQAWSLFTGAATLPDSLWEDLRDEVRPELRDRGRLYAGHLSRAGMEEAWTRFRHAIEPLRESGRLGVVILRYPHWMRPGETGRRLMLQARRRLADLELVVEFANPRWLDGGNCETTLGFLEDHDVGLVCVDSDHHPPVVAATSEVAVVRFAGRRGGDVDMTRATQDTAPGGDGAPASGEEPGLGPRRAYETEWPGCYRYSAEELEAWAPKLRDLAHGGGCVHVLFANTYRDFAVSNAAELSGLLARCTA